MPHRYFPSEFTQASAALTGPDAHHLGHVLRAKPGDEVTLCDGADGGHPGGWTWRFWKSGPAPPSPPWR